MKYDFSKMTSELEKNGLILSEIQLEQFSDYYDMLIEKNKVMNLTAITEFDDVLEKHFLDSVNIFRFMDLTEKKTIIDIGTGAGFPGIPLKIVFPNLDIVLADSLNKRINFLNEVIDKLGLTEITAIHGRAEDLARDPNYREYFDIALSRAVANLSTLSEYCLPFVKLGGMFISYKSGECDLEVSNSKSAIHLLGGKLSSVEKYELGDNSRSFVFIIKSMATSKKYPRKAGMPSKSPL